MDNQALVSVIIIFLNTEKFIEEAIESVFAQTYKNWELLLVDDGSTDNSTIIALEYAQKYSQIRYLHHENHNNRGTSVSRNLGIDHAQGEYIAFLDADDVWLPYKLEQQVAILESHPEAAMVYGRRQFWYSWTGNPEDNQKDHFFELGVSANTLIQPPQLLINTLKSSYDEPGPSNVIIRRNVFEKVGCFEESFRVWGEDKVFFAKVQLNLPIFVSGEFWIKYRQHQDSCCHIFEKNKKLVFGEYRNFLDWLEQYLLNQGMKNTEVWRVLRKTKIFYRYSVLHFLWRGYLDLAILISKRILPVTLRHWLWINIVSKLYGTKVKI